MTEQEILNFWFVECSPSDWWKKDSNFDQLIKYRFGNLHAKAIKGELFSWRNSPLGSLAEIIVLDQFSRNIYRDSPESFANDIVTVVLAQAAISKNFDQQLSIDERSFLYMPFMHSESLLIQQQGQPLFKSLAQDNTINFAKQHIDIIVRFGRFPHRNRVLGRKSTAKELEFLTNHNGF